MKTKAEVFKAVRLMGYDFSYEGAEKAFHFIPIHGANTVEMKKFIKENKIRCTLED